MARPKVRRVLARTQLPVCAWCDGPLDRPEWPVCSGCVDEYLRGLRRRRDAEQRLQPLADVLDLAS